MMVDHMASQSEPVAALLGAVGEALPPVLKRTSEALDAAADLIEPAGAWTQGSWGRLANGEPCAPGDADAICWCASGATMRTLGGRSDITHTEVKRWFEGATGHPFLSFNDARGRTQAEVVAAFRKAADLARAEGQ